jgi:hypothetical protein
MKTPMFVSLLLLALAPAPTDQAHKLELDHQPFLDDFRAAEGRVRLVTVLSPT